MKTSDNIAQFHRERRRPCREFETNPPPPAATLYRPASPGRLPNLAFTLMELMVAMGLGSLVLAAVASMSLYAARSEVAIVNYSDLDSKSRYGLDIISREVRQAQALTAFQTNTSLSFTNPQTAIGVTLTYNPTNATLVMTKTGQSPITVLTECDRWAFSLYQRTPVVTPTNISFYPATNTTGTLDPSLCKLISFSWKCSRTILAQKVNTESVQSAMVVLRNKQ
ncbi:MAG TPA: prepilin-type N-terminal cleavage/methylation domain-containing protein [Candidatus Acidoferrum sp.]|jgi:prepilin-type N-terminal cleavage/methylation domain-containing protein|nr:prepilin-type N-terminal cleavage/methylation domain-containing protein [Candidatus Acidoferrum sp.]